MKFASGFSLFSCQRFGHTQIIHPSRNSSSFLETVKWNTDLKSQEQVWPAARMRGSQVDCRMMTAELFCQLGSPRRQRRRPVSGRSTKDRRRRLLAHCVPRSHPTQTCRRRRLARSVRRGSRLSRRAADRARRRGRCRWRPVEGRCGAWGCTRPRITGARCRRTQCLRDHRESRRSVVAWSHKWRDCWASDWRASCQRGEVNWLDYDRVMSDRTHFHLWTNANIRRRDHIVDKRLNNLVTFSLAMWRSTRLNHIQIQNYKTKPVVGFSVASCLFITNRTNSCTDNDYFLFLHDAVEDTRILTRNSSGDEIANVNFLYDDIVHALKIQ